MQISIIGTCLNTAPCSLAFVIFGSWLLLCSTGRHSAPKLNLELGPASRSPMHHGTEPDLSASVPLPAGVAPTGLDLSPEDAMSVDIKRASVALVQVTIVVLVVTCLPSYVRFVDYLHHFPDVCTTLHCRNVPVQCLLFRKPALRVNPRPVVIDRRS